MSDKKGDLFPPLLNTGMKLRDIIEAGIPVGENIKNILSTTIGAAVHRSSEKRIYKGEVIYTFSRDYSSQKHKSNISDRDVKNATTKLKNEYGDKFISLSYSSSPTPKFVVKLKP